MLAWDRGGLHNPYLIVRVSADLVADVPEIQLGLGHWSGGWKPDGDWTEAEPDRAYEEALAAAYDMELDDMVETTVTFKESAA